MVNPMSPTVVLYKSKKIFIVLFIAIFFISLFLFLKMFRTYGNDETIKSNDLNFIKDFSVGESKIVIPEGTKVEWTYSEIKNYFGKDVLLKYIPVNIKENDTNNKKYVYNNQGTVTFDNISYLYSEDLSNPYAPKINYKISKGNLPIEDEVYFSNNTNVSTVNGMSLKIYCMDSNVYKGNIYSTSFIYDNIGYSIKTYSIPEEEFIKIIASIIN